MNQMKARWIAAALGLLCLNTLRAADIDTVVKNIQFAEGTIFVGDSLYFVDHGASDVLRLASGKTEKVWHLDGCGANGLVQVPEGLLVACYDNNTVVAISLQGKVLETIGKDNAGGAFSKPNDLT